MSIRENILMYYRIVISRNRIHFTSVKPTAPLESTSDTSLISILNGSLHLGFNPSISNNGSWPPTIGDLT